MKIIFLLSLAASLLMGASAALGLCPYVPGDVNGNGTANGIDVTYMVSYFKGGPPPPMDCHPYCPGTPSPFYAAGDVNGDCRFNGLDVYFFIHRPPNQPLGYCPICPPDGR